MQSRSISGVVYDENGGPLPGANVLISGTSNGTITDFNGKYTLNIPDATTTLIFSFVGYLNKTVEVNSRTVIDVTLEPDILALSEIVVVGYGTQSKKDLSIAASNISSKEINNTIQTNLASSLQGKIAGVQISANSGSPGGGASVRIRGVNSYNGASPLYVIDGVILGNFNPQYLNTDDVENITVLKDAAATAIYGARGAKGVVLITTKGGDFSQKPKISYNGYYGVQQVFRKLNLLNAKEYALLNNEARLNSGRTPRPEFADLDAIEASIGEGTDWQDAIFETAPIQQHGISFQGGSDITNYYIGGTVFDQAGIIGGRDKSRFSRYTLVANTNSDFGKKFRLSTNLTLSHQESVGVSSSNIFGGVVTNAINTDPITPVRLPNGDFAASPYQQTDIKNPLNAIALSNNIFTTDLVVGSIKASYEIIEGLSLESRFSANLSIGEGRSLNPDFQLFTIDGSAPPHESNGINSISSQYQRNSTLQNENILRYNRIIGDGHNLEVVAGQSFQIDNFRSINGFGTDLPTNDFDRAFLSSARTVTGPAPQGGFFRGTLFSVFGRVNYDYDKKYFFTGSIRRDGSSNFGPDNRYGVFPAFSGAWIISEEDFFGLPFINFLKLRAGWGINGSDDGTGATAFLTTINSGFNYNFGTGNPSNPVIGQTAGRPGNSELRWEEAEQINVGLNIGFLGEKLNAELDYYKKTTNDLIADVPVPAVAGFTSSPVGNVGSLTNEGFELGLNYTTNVNDIQIHVNGNMSYNDNVITRVDESIEGGEFFPNPVNLIQFGSPIVRVAPGAEVGGFHGFRTDGLFQTSEDIASYVNSEGELLQPNALPGDIRFVDLNDDGVIDGEDREQIGSPIPNFTYGLNLGLEFKGFDFSIFFQGAAGMQVVQAFLRSDFPDVNTLNSRLNRWTGPGTTNDARNPRVAFDDLNQNNRFSDRFVFDADYLRIRNIQLGYTLPRNISDKIKLERLRVYGSVQNLITWTSYTEGYDPEIGNRVSFEDRPTEQGVDLGFYPQAVTYTFGLNIDF